MKAPPETAPPSFGAWFDDPNRLSAEHRVVFGHWAALGLHRSVGYRALDTGCVWGGQLTALCLDDGRLFQQAALEIDPQTSSS